MKILKILLSLLALLAIPYLPIITAYLFSGMAFDYSATVTNDHFYLYSGVTSAAGIVYWLLSFAEHDNGFFFPDNN